MGRGPSIEGRKNAEDAKKAKRFTKFIRDITIAARSGGDPAGNPKLRAAIDKAIAANMTKDTVQRAIRRGTGEDGGAAVEEIRYEGYGPGGVAVLVDCLTDNPTRTIADVRHAFSKNGGNIGTTGSVAFQFTETGEIIFDLRETPDLEEKLMEAAIEAGADDVQIEDGFVDVLTQPEAFDGIVDALKSTGIEPIDAEVVMRPQVRVAVEGENAVGLRKMLAMLDALDDVQDVHHNAELPAG